MKKLLLAFLLFLFLGIPTVAFSASYDDPVTGQLMKTVPSGEGTYAELVGGNDFTGDQDIDGDLDVTGTITGTFVISDIAGDLIIDNPAATTLLTIGGTNEACIKIRDSDNAGWSYMVILDGTPTFSQTSCE